MSKTAISREEDRMLRGNSYTDSLHVRVLWVHHRPIGPTWNARGVQNSFWRCYRNDEDGAAIELADGLYSLQGGRLYLIPAGVRFNLIPPSRDVGHLFIHFDVLGMNRVMLQELFGRPVRLEDAADLEATAERLIPAVPRPRQVSLATRLRVKSLLFEGLARYLERVPPETIERCWQLARGTEPVQPALEYIEQHLAEPISNWQMAGACHLSEDYFIRRFRECVGETPAQYIQDRRISVATQRLLFSDDTIDQIARESGFANRFYFSRVFTRRVGSSPAVYRQRYRM
jgi:AraC-like DNA-binding protein